MSSLRFDNPKDPADVAPYTFDWSEHLGGRLDEEGEPEAFTITDAALSVRRLDTGSVDLIVDTHQVQGSKVIVVLSGGTANSSYSVECQIALSNGETYNREAVLQVKDL